MKTIKLFTFAFASLLMTGCALEQKQAKQESCASACTKNQRWSAEKAKEWYDQQGWIRGCNFIPSNAVNQLEMWQEDTFSPELIDKELGWAAELGFNTTRVYLHSMAWQQDKEGFKNRMDKYLTIANKHGIKALFVFFDDCWNAEATIGKQPAPKTGIHNSGWVQDPSVSRRADTTKLYAELKPYIIDVMTTFKNDKRILLWDMYNEPGNREHYNTSLPLLKKAFEWAREVNPSQPISAGIWRWDFYELNTFQLKNSDIVTYHCYTDKDSHMEKIHFLRHAGRPLICTEWMARRFDSTFDKVMPMLKEQHIGAINWGFVAGKTNTIYAWDDPKPDGKEPELWFHDIYRPDKTPFLQKEIDTIKQLTGK